MPLSRPDPARPVYGSPGGYNSLQKKRIEGTWRMSIRRSAARFAVLALLLLCACGGGGGPSTPVSPPSPPTYSIGGTVTGLVGSITLQNNGGDSLALSANGSFTFSLRVASGGAYTVSISAQPLGPDCAVTNGSGTVTSSVSNVSITCTVSPETRYLPLLATPTSGQGPSAGLYVLTNKSIDRPLVRITSVNTVQIALLPQLTLTSGASVIASKPGVLVYRTLTAGGGDHLWAVDLSGGSDLTPRQVGSLSIWQAPVAASTTVTLCGPVTTILRKLDDPLSAFHVLSISSEPSGNCVSPYQQSVVVFATDSPATAPRPVNVGTGTIEPVYRPDGTLAGMVSTNAANTDVVFFRDESFTNPVTLLANVTGFTALRDYEPSPWTDLVGPQTSLAILAEDGNFQPGIPQSVFRVDYSGTMSRLYDTSPGVTAKRIGADIYVNDQDSTANVLTWKLIRVPLDGLTGPLLLRTYAPDADCYADDPAGKIGSTLILLRLCLGPSQQMPTTRLLSADPGVPGSPSVIASSPGYAYGISFLPDRLLVTWSSTQSVNGGTGSRYATEMLGPTGITLQARLDGSAFPLTWEDPQDSVIQIRDIAGNGLGGGVRKFTAASPGAGLTSGMTNSDGSPASIPVGTVWVSFLGTGAGRGIGAYVAGSGVETDLAFDLPRGLVVKLAVAGADLSLISKYSQ